MSSAAAARQQRYRERSSDRGLAVLQITVNLNELSAALIAGDFLDEQQCDDKEAIARATERALAMLIKLSAVTHNGRRPVVLLSVRH